MNVMYGHIASEIIPQGTVLRFVFFEQKDLALMPFPKMYHVYGDKCFMRPSIHVWCKKFAQC